MNLTGKIALVTGAGRRIGRVTALSLARAGCDVVVHYNRSKSDAKATAGEIAKIGRRSETVQADLVDPARIEAMFTLIAQKFQRIDVLVNNAAIFARSHIETLESGQWDAMMAVNARAAALCIRYALPLMNAGEGAIVNITDVAAETPWPAYAAYCASKAALLSLTKNAAKALAGKNIRINAVAPGAILWNDNTTDTEKQSLMDKIPLKRFGKPEDIAAAVVFMAQHDYITGQTLRVDGGRCVR